MKSLTPNARWLLPAVIYTFFMIGGIGHGLPQTAGLMSRLTPLVLWGFGMLVVWRSVDFSRRGMRIWFFIVWIVTFALEMIGVQTGIIFGSYTYGAVLGRHIGGVPLVIGLNWVLVILGCVILCRRMLAIPRLFAPAVAVCTVLFDVLLEPVAIHLGWWHWRNETVPLQNYMAWFIISLASAAWFQRLRLVLRTSLPGHYAAAQAVFLLMHYVLRFVRSAYTIQ